MVTERRPNMEHLKSDSPEIKVVAKWLSQEWGREQGYTLGDTEAWCREVADCTNQAAICSKVHGQIVGVSLLVDCDLETEEGYTPWLSSLYVVPTYRGCGVGSQLIEATVAAALARGHDLLYLYAKIGPLTDYYNSLGWCISKDLIIITESYRITGESQDRYFHHAVRHIIYKTLGSLMY